MSIRISVQVTQERIDRYGMVNGDAERLHYDQAHAMGRGFRGTIAHGTMLAAPLFDLALRRFGPDFLVRGVLSIRWAAPVCAGDLLIASIDDRGRIEAVVDSLTDRPLSIVGQSTCGESTT